MSVPTPKFRRPPVTETVFGVQFAPLPSFGPVHLGLFWHGIRSEYPVQETKPPLDPVIEEFGRPVPRDVPKIELALMPTPEIRCWFIDQQRTELIQVQRDRFIRNWRKVSGSETYPSYDDLRPKFERDWLRFVEFLEGEGFGRPEVNQCEVTYVNHLPLGEGLESFGEMPNAVTVLSGASQQFLPAPEMIRLGYQYGLPDKKGRLYVELHPALRRHDGSPILQLTLTARGRPTSGGVEAIMAWLDLGHEWVVHGFVDFTRSEMHRRWERYR